MSSITAINWWWVAGAVIFDILSYVSQGMRWSLLLHPIGRASTFRATQAIYAGLFVNEILPMRLGEVLRIYLMSRWIPVRFATVVPSILVERFFDAIWLALALGITVFAVPLPKYLVDSEKVLGLAALAATIFFIYLVFYRKAAGTADPGEHKTPLASGPVGIETAGYNGRRNPRDRPVPLFLFQLWNIPALSAGSDSVLLVRYAGIWIKVFLLAWRCRIFNRSYRHIDSRRPVQCGDVSVLHCCWTCTFRS